jgi:hypothetical protein
MNTMKTQTKNLTPRLKPIVHKQSKHTLQSHAEPSIIQTLYIKNDIKSSKIPFLNLNSSKKTNLSKNISKSLSRVSDKNDGKHYLSEMSIRELLEREDLITEDYEFDDELDTTLVDRKHSFESAEKDEGERQSFEQLLKSIRSRLNEIEKDFSFDNLFNYLKFHLNYNGYGSLTLDSLHKLANPKTREYFKHQTRRKDFKESSFNVRGTSIQIYPWMPHHVTDAVPKLFKNLEFLKQIFIIIQRDLLIYLQNRDYLSDDESLNNYTFRKNYQLKVPGRKRLSHSYLFGIDDNNDDSSNRLNNNKKIGKQEKTIQLIVRFQHYLDETNEKLSLLLNDYTSSDLRLLSEFTKLPQKYVFFKSGEYILRLIPDVLYKMKLLLRLFERTIELKKTIEIQNHNYTSSDKEIIGLPQIRQATHDSPRSIIQRSNSFRQPSTKTSIRDEIDKQLSERMKSYISIKELDSSILSDDTLEAEDENLENDFMLRELEKVKKQHSEYYYLSLSSTEPHAKANNMVKIKIPTIEQNESPMVEYT